MEKIKILKRPKRIVCTFYLRQDLVKIINEEAKKESVSLNWLAEQILLNYFGIIGGKDEAI
jgi:predicted HicB family RNase H-like nuclease